MDLTALLSELVSSNVVDNLGKATGTSTNDVQKVLGSALPQLLSGASQQATSQDTMASFAQALQQHSVDDTSDLAKYLGNYDRNDGAKIVQHLLGNQTQTVTNQVAKKTGVSGMNVGAILAIVAPLLLKTLGSNAAKAQQQQQQLQQMQQQQQAGAFSTDAISSMMGSLMGGSQQNDMSSILGALMGQQPQQKKSGGILGELLKAITK
jgi:hypothetical protein